MFMNARLIITCILISIFRSPMETSVKQETSVDHISGAGLRSLIPRKNEPSMMLGWQVGRASLLLNQGNKQ